MSRYGSTIGGKPGGAYGYAGAYGPITEWCRQLFPTTKIIRGTAKYRVSYLVVRLLKV